MFDPLTALAIFSIVAIAALALADRDYQRQIDEELAYTTEDLEDPIPFRRLR